MLKDRSRRYWVEHDDNNDNNDDIIMMILVLIDVVFDEDNKDQSMYLKRQYQQFSLHV